MNQKPVNQGSLDQLTLASFFPLLGTRFRVRYGDASEIELELTEATQLPPARPQNPDRPSPQNEIEHDQIGQFCLFLVPIGRNQQGFQYQAIFNRMA
jgi:hypothetical protein